MLVWSIYMHFSTLSHFLRQHLQKPQKTYYNKALLKMTKAGLWFCGTLPWKLFCQTALWNISIKKRLHNTAHGSLSLLCLPEALFVSPQSLRPMCQDTDEQPTLPIWPTSAGRGPFTQTYFLALDKEVEMTSVSRGNSSLVHIHL